MILPQTFMGTLIVAILGLLCAGLWANTFKAGRLRFELYYVDFAFGLFAAAVLIAFTAGNLGFDGFSISDDLMQTRKLQWMDAFGAGVLFNLANMLLVAAISVSGMGIAIPVASAITFVAAALLGQFGRRPSEAMYLYVGCALALAAFLAYSIAHSQTVAGRKRTLGKQPKSNRAPGAGRGLVLAIVSGSLMLGVYPLTTAARAGETGMGPYVLLMLFGAGAFLSTFMFSLFFINLPVQGHALDITDYFQLPFQRHGIGFVGGILCCVGICAFLVVPAVIPEAQLGRFASFALARAVPIVAALCGLLIWNEFAEGGGRAKAIASAALILLGGGVWALATAFS